MIRRILSLALCLMLVCLPCALADQDPATLNVAGSATVSLPADAALITLGVRETAADVQEAQSTVNEKIAAIRTALTEMGIDNADIATESLYIYANYDYNSFSGNAERIESYSATNTLNITVRNIDQTGAVIDAAFAAGANTLDNVNFYATDVSAASDQAYAEAVADAMHKAGIIADAAGMQLGSIAEITEGSTNTWVDNATKLRASAYAVTEDAAAGTDIQQSNVVVTANVSITYTLSK